MICKDTKRGIWTVRYWRKNTEGKLTQLPNEVS